MRKTLCAPAASGTMAALAALCMAVGGCRKATEQHPAPATEAGARSDEHLDEPKHEGLPRRVRLTPKVAEDAKIRVAPVVREVLSEVLSLPGEIAADPDRVAKVSAPISGRLERVDFREGSVLKRGEVLAVVRVPDFARAKADLAAMQAKATAARSNADRLTELESKGLAATQEALSARAEAAALEAQARAAGELVRAVGGSGEAINSRLTLRAPIAGTAITRAAVVGQPVTPDDTIATIADLSEVWFLGRVFEKDLERVHVGAASDVVLNAFPNEHFDGKVDYVSEQVDPVARTVTARIRVTNRDNVLRLGLFGMARVATATDRPKVPALVVPNSAVVEVAGKNVVFVRQPDGDYELHDVVLGASSPGKMEVVSGLREGELVVIEGAFTLKSIVLRGTFGQEE